jgi:hypothetical protein
VGLDIADASKGRSQLPQQAGRNAGEGTSAKPASGRQGGEAGRTVTGRSQVEQGDAKSAKPEKTRQPVEKDSTRLAGLEAMPEQFGLV